MTKESAPRYGTNALREVWSDVTTRTLMFELWEEHLAWMSNNGWEDALRKAPPLDPQDVSETHQLVVDHFTGSGHEVVDLLRQFFHRTGLVNAHAGLSSSDIVDNVRLIQCARSVPIICNLLDATVKRIGRLALDTPCLGYTHWRPATPLVWSRRVFTWNRPLLVCFSAYPTVRAKRFGGATGTGEAIRIILGREPAPFPWEKFDVSRPALCPLQSSDHICELECMAWLSAIAAQLHKIAADVRFLCGTGELIIKREEAHRGSSSMPRKVNPIEAEKCCSLCRLVPGCYRAIWDVMAHNGLERTLDTSAAIKETLPRAFGLVGQAVVSLGSLAEKLTVNQERCKYLVSYNFGPTAPAPEIHMAREIANGKSRLEVYENEYRL